METTWWRYVKDNIGEKNSLISALAGVRPSAVTRWEKQGQIPKASTVIDIARKIKQSPIDALVAAEYLTPEEGNLAMKAMSDEQFAKEAYRRLLDYHLKPMRNKGETKLSVSEDIINEAENVTSPRPSAEEILSREDYQIAAYRGEKEQDEHQLYD